MAKDWIKLWTKEWLFGSSRRELTSSERAIWIDLLALAGIYDKEGKRNGVIEVDIDSLPRLLNVRSEVLHRALTKFSQPSSPDNEPKITITGRQISITNWAKYNPTRSEIWDAENPDQALDRKRYYDDYFRLQKTTPDVLEGDREGEGGGDRDIYISLSSSKWYQGFRKDYPAFKDSDLAAAYEWIAEWNEGHPRAKPRSVTKRFLINWAKKKEEGSGRDKRNPKSGRVPKTYTPADEL